VKENNEGEKQGIPQVHAAAHPRKNSKKTGAHDHVCVVSARTAVKGEREKLTVLVPKVKKKWRGAEAPVEGSSTGFVYKSGRRGGERHRKEKPLGTNGRDTGRKQAGADTAQKNRGGGQRTCELRKKRNKQLPKTRSSAKEGGTALRGEKRRQNPQNPRVDRGGPQRRAKIGLGQTCTRNLPGSGITYKAKGDEVKTWSRSTECQGHCRV